MTYIKSYTSHGMHFFAPALTVSEIFTFQIGDLQYVDHGIEFSQCFHSMAEIKIYKSRSMHFCVISDCIREINVRFLYLQKVDQSHTVQFSQRHHSMANIKIYTSRPINFACASCNRFRDINVSIFTFKK